ncbi:hypothetical protein GOODEAATRI_021784, partial [Goodea atripinnis]
VGIVTRPALQTWQSSVQWIILPQISILAILSGSSVDVGVVVAVGADDKRTCTT